MNIFIRVDSSTIIGTGHVVRCLTLAGQFHGEEHKVTFICRELPGNIIDQISKAGYEVHKLAKANYDNINLENTESHLAWLAVDWQVDARQTVDILKSLQKPADLLIIDHYALDINWEKEVKEYCGNLMVIDDLADRKHICDFLLDQNYYKNLSSRYDDLVPDSCQKMLGPSYALLRPEFYLARKNRKQCNDKIKRILVFFGGNDSYNQTKIVLNAISYLSTNNVFFDVVIGDTNQHIKEIENICKTLNNVTLHKQIDYMAELMAKSDLAIGGGGTTTWERCFMGLPCLTIILAQNQKQMVIDLAEYGALWNLGWYESVTAKEISAAMEKALSNNAAINTLKQKMSELMHKHETTNGNIVARLILGKMDMATNKI